MNAVAEPNVIRKEVEQFYGPHAHRRVLRGGSLRRAFLMEKEEERSPGTHTNDFIDFIEEERWAYHHRVWNVKAVIDAVTRLRELGHETITLSRDGRITVEVGDGEPCGRETQRAFGYELHLPPVSVWDRRSCCNPRQVYTAVSGETG